MHKAWTSLAAIGVLSIGLPGCDRNSHPGNIGKAAPQFVMTDGVETVDLSKLRGKVVVLNLWATWCAPCVQELPSLLALKQKMPDIAVVAVSTDQDEEVYRQFLVKHHVDMPTVRDSGQKVNALYGTVQIPETYIIDRQEFCAASSSVRRIGPGPKLRTTSGNSRSDSRCRMTL